MPLADSLPTEAEFVDILKVHPNVGEAAAAARALCGRAQKS